MANLVGTKQNECNCICRISVVQFQKNSWFQLMWTLPTSVNLAMLIYKLFQSRLQVGQFKSYAVSLILFMSRQLLVFIMRMQCLGETLLRKISMRFCLRLSRWADVRGNVETLLCALRLQRFIWLKTLLEQFAATKQCLSQSRR